MIGFDFALKHLEDWRCKRKKIQLYCGRGLQGIVKMFWKVLGVSLCGSLVKKLINFLHRGLMCVLGTEQNSVDNLCIYHKYNQSDDVTMS